MIALLASCHKVDKQATTQQPADNTSILSIIQNYLAFSKTKVDGRFMFESNVTNNDNSNKNTALTGGVFYDTAGNVLTGKGTVSIGNNQLAENNYGTYGFDKILSRDGLFGTNVTFTLTPPSPTADPNVYARPDGTSTVSGTVYSPAPIQITNVAPQTPLTIQANTAIPLTWNTDPNNPNGVIVIAEYLPTLYANKTVLSNGYINFLTNSVLVSDNGSTTLPANFFAQYPRGSQVILWVARGNYTILSNGKYNYQVGGYTAAAVWDVVIPYPTTGSFAPYTAAGWTNAGSSISSTSAGVVSFQIALTGSKPPASWTSSFTIGTISGCPPSGVRSFTCTDTYFGTIWNVSITTSGEVSVAMVGGKTPPVGYTTIHISGTYTQ